MDYSREANLKSKRKQNSMRKKITNKVGILVFRVFVAVVLIGGFAAMGAGVGLYMGVIKNAPKVDDIQVMPNIYTTIIYDNKTGAEVDRLRGDENRTYIQIGDIPQHLRDAIVAIEDERFYEHDGVDFRGIARAVYTVVESKGGRMEGASTITQQLIKNNIMKINANTVITKLQEQYMAVEYEKIVTKARGNKPSAKNYILELYLNTINLGYNYHGVQTAVKHYFGKEVADLTLAESAVIAAITQNPSKYAPDRKAENNKERQTLVLKKMLELGMITEQQYNTASGEDVYNHIKEVVEEEEEKSSAHSFFIDALVSQVIQDLQDKYLMTANQANDLIYNRGLKIYSTQDLEMQRIVDESMQDDSFFPRFLYKVDVQYYLTIHNTVTGKTENILKKETVKSMEDVQPQIQAWKEELLKIDDEYTERYFAIPQPQVAMVIMDYHNGQVKAIAGGRGSKTDNRTFNRAIDAYRSPGSTFKVLASYAPALDLGKITPSSVLVDEPFTYNGYSPKNWWGSGYRGAQTIRSAIAQSMNILAVKNLVNTGIDDCFRYLLNFGFTSLVESENRDGQIFTDKVAPLALGGLTNGVNQLELTAAYGTIANGGIYIKPTFYDRVLDHDENILLELPVQPNREVIQRSTALVLTDIMKSVITEGTGKAARFKKTAMPIAGKTGTSSETKDLTFVAFTPYYVAGIWGGYDSSEPMISSGSFHLPLWSHIMEEIHKDLPVKNFDISEGVTMAEVCNDSGMLATDICRDDPRGNRVTMEVFVNGTQPTGTCDQHRSVTIDTSTGKKANRYCPSSVRETMIGIVISDEEITDSGYQIPKSVADGPTCTYHGPHSFERPTHALTEPGDLFTPPDYYSPDPNAQQPAVEMPDSVIITPEQPQSWPEAPVINEPNALDDFSYFSE